MRQSDLFESKHAEGYWERVAAIALALAQSSLEAYGSPYSRKDFTQRQLLVILVLKQLQKTTYRGVCAFLESTPGVRETIGLSHVPHYTTAQKFADRADVLAVVDAMLAQLADALLEEQTDMAIDSTGLEVSCASRYYASKRSDRESRYVKLSLAVLCGLCLPCAIEVDWGPGSDLTQAPALIDKAMAVATPTYVYMDRGYDCERIHEQLRDRYGVQSVIPPVGRGPDKVVRTRYRSLMREGLPGQYGRRWHSETVISGIKRLTGSGLRSRGTRRPLIEAALKALAYAIHR